jgi:archaemetzincin
MRTIAVITTTALTILLLTGCARKQENFFQPGNQDKIIAVQPFNRYDTHKLDFICKEIGNFYNARVIVLNPVTIPETYRLPLSQSYSADSILDLLSTKLSREIIEVVGVTSLGIGIKQKGKPRTTHPFHVYPVQRVFGLADFTGNCAVISDAYFRSADSTVFQHRLRTTVIHEMGHNIGLDHCSFERCVMAEQNGTLFGLDISENDYCINCRKKLKKINPFYTWLNR